MKIRAAMLLPDDPEWVVTDLDVDGPKAGEVMVRMAYAGLCFSEEHTRLNPATLRPMVCGHEGAGVVEAVGPGVQRLKIGDHVVASVIPVCGRCHYCSSGRSNLCNEFLSIVSGRMKDGTYRFHRNGNYLPAEIVLGTFAEVVTSPEDSWVPLPRHIPLEIATLISCGVLTGWGSSVYAANLRLGDTALVVGAGGVGLNAVQGAVHAGAAHILAVDPLPAKRQAALAFGATEAFATVQEAAERSREIRPMAQGADACILCVGQLSADVVSEGFDATGRGGTLVLAGMSHDPTEINVKLPGTLMASSERRIQGSLYGSTNPFMDVPLILSLYSQGKMKLDQLISATYPLEDIRKGYADLSEGRNLRGLIRHRG